MPEPARQRREPGGAKAPQAKERHGQGVAIVERHGAASERGQRVETEGLRQVAVVESRREIHGQVSTERRYYIASHRTLDAKRTAQYTNR